MIVVLSRGGVMPDPLQGVYTPNADVGTVATKLAYRAGVAVSHMSFAAERVGASCEPHRDRGTHGYEECHSGRADGVDGREPLCRCHPLRRMPGEQARQGPQGKHSERCYDQNRADRAEQ